MDLSCWILGLESYAGIYHLLLLPREVRCEAMVTYNMDRIAKAVLLQPVICKDKQSHKKRAQQKSCSGSRPTSRNKAHTTSNLTSAIHRNMYGARKRRFDETRAGPYGSHAWTSTADDGPPNLPPPGRQRCPIECLPCEKEMLDDVEEL